MCWSGNTPFSTMSDGNPLRILLIGASGVFGSRLAERIALEPNMALTLAGRRRAPLDVLAAQIGGGAVRMLDRSRVEPRDLAGYDLIIDAAGPFQASTTTLVEAAIAAKVDYVDLADGREWIASFAQFDLAARAAGVSLVAGASSIPALSHAVLDQLVAGWREIETIWIGIFPGNRAPRGLSVVEAILSYAGKPVRVFKEGRWTRQWGWGALTRVDAGPAGRRWASVCDTPEQDLLVARYHPTRSAEFFAGMELTLLHLGLSLLSWPVRLGWVDSIRQLARPLLSIAQWLLPFGGDRGAMLIDVRGVDRSGNPVDTRWLLSAEANRGPYVPVLAALVMARRRRDGHREPPGARICSGLLALSDFDEDFATLGIKIGS